MSLFVFLNKGFTCEPYLCNGCHDLMQKAMNFNVVVIVSIKGNDYKIHFWYMSKDDAINITKKSNLNEKQNHYISQYNIFLFLNVKDE